MARKKDDPPKPLFSVKQDFVNALENVCGETLMLLQAVEMALRHGDVAHGVKDILTERANAMRAALVSED